MVTYMAKKKTLGGPVTFYCSDLALWEGIKAEAEKQETSGSALLSELMAEWLGYE